jgi:hypothetical protein
MGSRVGLDDVEKKKFLTLPRFEQQPLGRTVHRQSPGEFPQFLQATAKIVLRLGCKLFLPNPFQFINQPVIQRYHAISRATHTDVK